MKCQICGDIPALKEIDLDSYPESELRKPIEKLKTVTGCPYGKSELKKCPECFSYFYFEDRSYLPQSGNSEYNIWYIERASRAQTIALLLEDVVIDKSGISKNELEILNVSEKDIKDELKRSEYKYWPVRALLRFYFSKKDIGKIVKLIKHDDKEVRMHAVKILSDYRYESYSHENGRVVLAILSLQEDSEPKIRNAMIGFFNYLPAGYKKNNKLIDKIIRFFAKALPAADEIDLNKIIMALTEIKKAGHDTSGAISSLTKKGRKAP